MIRPLRRRHGWMWLLLTPLMVWILVAAWTNREHFPLVESPPPEVEGEILLSQDRWAEDSAIGTRVLRLGEGLILELTPLEASKKPDVLVYWSFTATSRRPSSWVL